MPTDRGWGGGLAALCLCTLAATAAESAAPHGLEPEIRATAGFAPPRGLDEPEPDTKNGLAIEPLHGAGTRAHHFLVWWAARPPRAKPKYLPTVNRGADGWASLTRCNARLAFSHIFKAAGTAIQQMIAKHGGCSCELKTSRSRSSLCVEANFRQGSEGVVRAGLRHVVGVGADNIHRGSSSSLLFSVARHPVERFEAAVCEIHRRTFSPRYVNGHLSVRNWTLPDAPEEQLVGDMLRSILLHNRLWDVHLKPQYKFLLELQASARQGSGKPAALPVDYIADTATLETDLRVVFRAARMEATMAAHHGSPTETRNSENQLNRTKVKASPAEVRVICELYYEDFVALGYALPEQCQLPALGARASPWLTSHKT